MGDCITCRSYVAWTGGMVITGNHRLATLLGILNQCDRNGVWTSIELKITMALTISGPF